MRRFEPLREVARLYFRQQRETVSFCGDVSLTQCWILTEIGRSGPVTLRQLAHAVGFDKSWTSRAVDGLIERGLIAKKGDADDGRRVRLSLTSRGETHFERLNRTLDGHAKLVMQRIPSDQRLAVRRALVLLHDALQQHAHAVTEERRRAN